MLRGFGIRGGPLGFQTTAGGGSCFATTNFRSPVEVSFKVWARAPLRLHFVSARPYQICCRRSLSPSVCVRYLTFPARSHYNLDRSYDSRDVLARGSALLVRTQFSTRVRWLLLAGMILWILPQYLSAQDDGNDTPLGDVARSFRKKPSSPEAVIDNDNFSKVVEDAEGRRARGSTMVFSLDPGGKSFQVSSPDVSCNLSFSAKNSALLSDPALLDELPRNELAKLEGPATIDGDSLQISVHNGTAWDLREVLIGLTILRQSNSVDAASSFGHAHIVPAAAGGAPDSSRDPAQKQPDVTVLLWVKGSAAPSATALFRTQLNFALFPDQEWHWAIVKAKGVPPQAPPQDLAAQPEQNPARYLVGSTEVQSLGAPTPLSAPPTPAVIGSTH